MSEITQEIVLPSKGLLTPSIPGGKLKQRCMMVSDKKFLSGSLSGGKVTELLERTIVEPESADVGELSTSDSLYLLFKLRILSYGEEYKYRDMCPVCYSNIDVSLDLSKLEVVDLDPDYEESMRVVLPRTGDTVYTKIVNNYASEAVSDEVRKAKKRGADLNEYVLRISSSIKKIVLKKAEKDKREITDIFDIRDYVESLTDYDATAIEAAAGSARYGIVPIVPYVCPECDSEIDLDIKFDPEFFRPKFNR